MPTVGSLLSGAFTAEEPAQRGLIDENEVSLAGGSGLAALTDKASESESTRPDAADGAEVARTVRSQSHEDNSDSVC